MMTEATQKAYMTSEARAWADFPQGQCRLHRDRTDSTGTGHTQQGQCRLHRDKADSTGTGQTPQGQGRPYRDSADCTGTGQTPQGQCRLHRAKADSTGTGQTPQGQGRLHRDRADSTAETLAVCVCGGGGKAPKAPLLLVSHPLFFNVSDWHRWWLFPRLRKFWENVRFSFFSSFFFLK